ncbi:MAG: DUF721 domain-containing protein [Betaproteobacteria bacterium]|nr:MAG: DUF721 domain-containing protein [Betaproteobacteria bacterium]
MPTRWRSESVTDRALARRSEIRIICTTLPSEHATPVRLPRLDRILAAEGELQPVLAKARDIRALAGLVTDFLPLDLARQARAANFRDGEVILVAANSAAAAKLRLLAPSLCRYLSERRWQVNSVSVRVQPNRTTKDGVASQKSAHLSTRTLDSLRNLYESMTDSPAREALRTLLQRRGATRPTPRAGAAPRERAAGSARPRKPRP